MIRNKSGEVSLLEDVASGASDRVSSSAGTRETTPRWVWTLVGVLVILGTVNFVLLSTLYKSYTDEYAFFVNQGINFMYVIMGGVILYPKQLFTDEINDQTGLKFPQRRFFFMGFLDSLGTLFTALGAVHCPSIFQPLLNQTLIPFTILFSNLFLGSRYHPYALAGAGAIILGASMTVLSCATGNCNNDSDVSVKWYAILIYCASNIPMALSAVYKEIAFKDVKVNVWYLCQWVSIYQFILSWLYLPITVLPQFAGDGWSNLLPRFMDGLRCTFGGAECSSAFDAPFPCEERKGVFWLLFGYCVVNFSFNYVGLVLTKFGSATIRSISYAVILPATSLAFCLPLMGSLQETLTPFVPVAIVIVLFGFFLYQRYADDDPASDKSACDDEEDDDTATKGHDEGNDTEFQPVFCERTGGLDIVKTRGRNLRRRKSGRSRAYSTPHTPSAALLGIAKNSAPGDFDGASSLP